MTTNISDKRARKQPSFVADQTNSAQGTTTEQVQPSPDRTSTIESEAMEVFDAATVSTDKDDPNPTQDMPSDVTCDVNNGQEEFGKDNPMVLPQDVPPETTSDPEVPKGDPEVPKEKTKDEPLMLKPAAIVKLAHDAKTLFLQDQHGDVFAWVRTPDKDKHSECLRLRSKAYRASVLDLIKSRTKEIPKPSDLKQAIEILELQACRSRRTELANRRSVQGNRTLIDLGDPGWRMISVTEKGWKVEQQSKPLFYRPQHQQPLREPIGGGNLWDLFEFLPVETEEEKLVIATWALAAMHSAVSSPILLFVGEQGSAKTTRSRRLRSLLDPSVTPVLGDLEMSNLFLTFQHHAVPCFENVSRFNRREADMFCRAVTGNGVERRKLYTDSDQALYSFRRPIIINGIDTPSTRPDFLDRCLIINCRRVDKFKTLQELDQKFESALPKLLGAMLDLLAKTLRLQASTPAATEFRMADFAWFGRAVAQALGKTHKDFDDAYRLNIRQQDFEILEDSPMTRLVKKFASQHPEINPWKGTAEELLAHLKLVAKNHSDEDAKRDLPRSARWLSSRLCELAAALATQGVIVSKRPRTNTSRELQVFLKTPQNNVAVTEVVREKMEGGENHE